MTTQTYTTSRKASTALAKNDIVDIAGVHYTVAATYHTVGVVTIDLFPRDGIDGQFYVRLQMPRGVAVDTIINVL